MLNYPTVLKREAKSFRSGRLSVVCVVSRATDVRVRMGVYVLGEAFGFRSLFEIDGSIVPMMLQALLTVFPSQSGIFNPGFSVLSGYIRPHLSSQF